jgi:DNA-binding transcriptional regulator YbjK
MTGPADKPSERGLASDDDNGRLLTRAFKAIMKIDMAFHIHFTSSVADKKRQLEQVVKMHYYLAMGSKSPEDGEKLV